MYFRNDCFWGKWWYFLSTVWKGRLTFLCSLYVSTKGQTRPQSIVNPKIYFMDLMFFRPNFIQTKALCLVVTVQYYLNIECWELYAVFPNWRIALMRCFCHDNHTQMCIYISIHINVYICRKIFHENKFEGVGVTLSVTQIRSFAERSWSPI